MPEMPDRVDRIVLIGLMGSGKTTVGKHLAARLGWKLVDLDYEIEQKAQLSVAEIFRERGEETFRRLEQQLTRELASSTRMVFTPGGGWATRAENVQLLPPDSAVFWLRVSADEAVRRVGREGVAARPLLAADPVQRAMELAQARDPLYAKYGVPIDTMHRSSEEVAGEILSMVGERVAHPS